MQDQHLSSDSRYATSRHFATLVLLVVGALATASEAATVNVTVKTETSAGLTFAGSLRWTLEEDVTYEQDPANPTAPFDSPTLQLHKSNMPVAKTGVAGSGTFSIAGLDPAKRYYLSILPDRPAGASCTIGDGCYTMSGAPVRFADGTPGDGSTGVTVTVTAQPLPPAQIRIFTFHDIAPINNSWDVGELGLGGFTVFIYDLGGPLMTDVFGNPLGTEYEPGTLDGDAAPSVIRLGDGTLHTMTAAEVADPGLNPQHLKVGELVVRNIAPGKYGVRIVPPAGQEWQQTTTIEGTPGIDAWVRAGEPFLTSNLVEFGPTFAHAFFGFVQPMNNLAAAADGGSISGTVANLRMARAPDGTFYDGQAFPNCWIGLNDMASGVGVYAAPCEETMPGDPDNSSFSIPDVPPGDYQLVVWDRYLDLIIGFFTVSVGSNEDVALGKVSVPYWFHVQHHYVFNDDNGNAMRDPGELPIPEQAVNFRYRDGSVYQSSTTDTEGFLPFDEVFPFFSGLIAEIDFARFQATGVTIAVDEGGNVDNGPIGQGILNPQEQDPADGGTTCSGGICQTRTECNTSEAQCVPGTFTGTSPALLEWFNGFAGNTNRFEWGKKPYEPGKNGGITGVVFFQITRAENDPRYATPETWEPGIPRVQVNLYRSNADGDIQDINAPAGIQLADVDNPPLGWQDDPLAIGDEDVDRNGNGSFDMGDAIEATHTDSFDDNIPAGCRNDTLVTTAVDPTGRCYDGLRNWAQVRPAVFDGGYAFGAPFTALQLASGNYVIEANAPPGYEHQTEQSKNVDFGDTFVPQQLPPVCVGDPGHTGGQQSWNVVGDELSLFPGVETDPVYRGNRPFCSFKQVIVTDAKNTAADFFMYTDVPISGHIQGLTTNDLGNEPNLNSPNFNEKQAPAYIPISMRDYAGNEVNRFYTDEWGHYNGLVPSTYRISVPMPSGVSPNMAQVCLNPSTKPDPANPGSFILDPYHDPRYSQTCYVFNFTPGVTTYLDTPVLPVAAYVSAPDWQLDCAMPDGTPVIREASVSTSDALGSGNGPYIAPGGSRVLKLHSVGMAQVADPELPRPNLVTRNFGFGGAAGTVLLNGTPIPAANVVWGDDIITVNVPSAAPFNTSGQMDVIRADGASTVHGITLIQGAATEVTSVVQGDSIQDAVDATNAGGIVLVAPGLYYEGLIITKPIQLQGWGAASTIINAARSGNFAEFNSWRETAHARTNCPLADATQRIGLLPGQPNNVGPGTNACEYLPGTGLFATEEHAALIVAPTNGQFGTLPARIDGLTFTGAEFSGGLIVNGYATGLEISNNIISNNQGQAAGGIRVGHPSLVDANGELVSAENKNLKIHNNHVMQNGSTFDHGGGIGIYNGSDNYQLSSNYVCGNFAQGDGAGIAHYGRSPGGVIEKNKILFNQSFDQTATGQGGSGGGILIAGHEQPVGAAIALSAGTGSVRINGNLIQGNQAGSADGGGIALRSVNGQDVLASPNDATWNRVQVLNNIIVNNVTGLAGGGISLQDALRVAIVNNTIANNDSTATSAAAFGTDPNASVPQPAGIVSRAHSAALEGLPFVGTFSDPTLENNIIFSNRQQHWEVPAVPGTSGLMVDGVQDLAVLGIAGSLNPQRNILTNDPVNSGYSASNIRVLLANANTLFSSPYYNGDNGAIPPTATFFDTMLSATANDEGGNFLSVVHGPLSLVGNYHLAAGSPAIDPVVTGGTNGILSSYPALLRDYDSNPRPVDGTAGNGVTIRADLGADEVTAVALATAAAPQILSTPPAAIAYVGVPFVYQVVAVDPNNTSFKYGVTCASAPGSACGTGPTISSTGLMTWTPGAVGVASITVRACSPEPAGNCIQSVPAAGRANQQFGVVVSANIAPPTATNDQFNVDSAGTFSVAAPGVIGNDSASALYGAMAAELVANVAAGSGSVTLAPSGAFSYNPPAGFVGTTSFQYRVSATRILSGTVGTSNTATVTLNRELAPTSMQYAAASAGGGTWTLSGNGSTNGRTLTFTLVRTGETIGSTTVSGGTWSLVAASGPVWQAGDTVTINATGGGLPAFGLGMVPVAAVNVGPLSGVTTTFVQCPLDSNGNGVLDEPDEGTRNADGNWVNPADPEHPNAVCRHLGAGDGYVRMADDTEIYIFGFSDVSLDKDGVPVLAAQTIADGLLNANFPAPTLVFDQGDEVYLSLTNVGTLHRPDLFDPHTVHFHGFPNASAVFDGVPESSIMINFGFTLTYFYNIVEPGTFMYHCHVEAAEHMQMGMLGNLYVRPEQNGSLFGGYTKFVYNDGNGDTGYDVEVPIQIGSFDRNFHEQHIAVQPLPFAEMHDDYPMLNGRGYPDTVNTAPDAMDPAADSEKLNSGVNSASESSQKLHSRVSANAGQRILLRISNLNVTQFYTLATTGLKMKVVGTGAHILRGPGGTAANDLSYETSSVTLGGGEAVDVLIDTNGVAPGTYLLYSTNLNELSNGTEDFGGMMTEIVIN